MPNNNTTDGGTAAGNRRDRQRAWMGAEQVRLLFRHGFLTQLIALLVAGLTVAIMWPVVERRVLLAWFAVFCVLTLARLALVFRFKRRGTATHPHETWARAFLVGVALSALAWGSAGYFLFPPESLPHQVFLLFVLGGICTGAVAFTASYRLGFLLFAVPTLLPVTARFVLQGDDLSLVIAVLTVVYVVGMAVASMEWHRLLNLALRLRGENLDLVQNLSNANRRLRSEVAERRETQRALQDAEEKYRQLFLMETDAIVMFDAESLELIDANDAALRLYGYDRDSLIDREVTMLTADDLAMRRLVADVLASPSGRVTESVHRHQDGREFPVEMSISAASLRDRRIVCALIRDITVRQQSQEAQRQREGRFKDFAESAADWFWETDSAMCFTYLDGNWSRVTGLPIEEVVGRSIATTLMRGLEDESVEQRLRARVATRRPFEDLEIAWKRPDGARRVLSLSGRPMYGEDGAFLGYRGVGRDVTVARLDAERMRHQARHDALTGLLNRREFELCLNQALEEARARGTRHVIGYMDLDRFKQINDSVGHLAGDELLRQLADLLRKRIRGGDILARLGGDEFGLILGNCTLGQARSVAQHLVDAVRDFRFTWHDRTFEIGVSVGLADCDPAAGEAMRVLGHADAACYAAKDLGPNRVYVYRTTRRQKEDAAAAMTPSAGLRELLEREQFRLFCQPIWELSEHSRSVHRFELLLRVVDDDGRVVLPRAFLQAAQRQGLMGKVDRWVISHGIKGQREFVNGSVQIGISVNLSGNALTDRGLWGYLRDQIAEHSFDPALLCLELPELVASSNRPQAERAVREIRDIGCRFAIDNFGGAGSFLGYLKDLAPDYLKIDASLVRGVGNTVDRAMISAINEVGHVIGMRTVASGANSEELIAMVLEVGVDYVQGNALCPALPLEQGRRVAAAQRHGTD